MRHQIIQANKLENGGIFKVYVQIPLKEGWIERVMLYVWGKEPKQLEHLKNEKDYAYFMATFWLENNAIYHYHFSYEANGNFQYCKKRNFTRYSNVRIDEVWKLSVGTNKVPEWAKGAIMYHIFVDRYRKGKDSNIKAMPNRTIHKNWQEAPVIGPNEDGQWNIDFYGGNLKGIIEALDYIKSLGVTILYLSPICTSQSNHRYDTADYMQVDPYVGTNEILKELCDKSHAKGMKVILDAVFNHTGNDSIYYDEYGTYGGKGAYENPESLYYDFYKKEVDKDTGKLTQTFWWDNTNLPVCDGNSPHWKKFIYGKGGVIDKWCSLGIDGLRLDVADELTDEFIKGISKALKRNKSDAFLIGEVWYNPIRMGRKYMEYMHTVMNYLMMDAFVRYYKYCDIEKLNTILREIYSEYPTETISVLMNSTSTHDISRPIELYGCNVFEQYGEWGWNIQERFNNAEWIESHELASYEYKKGKAIYKSYSFALTFLPGIFSIFYGDEVGTHGIGNLANRATFPWENMDKDLLKFFRKIGKIRKELTFLKEAEFRVVKVDHEKFAFERYNKSDKILVIVSRAEYAIQLNLPREYQNAEIIFHIKGSNKQQLLPYGAIALKKY